MSAFKYGFENYLTDETCAIYQGRGHTNGLKWSPSMKCRSWFSGKPWQIPDNYRVYNITEFGRIKGEENMKQEIFQRGPIVCNKTSFRYLIKKIYINKKNKIGVSDLFWSDLYIYDGE